MLGKTRRCHKMCMYYHEAEVMLIHLRVKLFFSRHGKIRMIQQEVLDVRLNELLMGLLIEILNIMEDLFEIDASN